MEDCNHGTQHIMSDLVDVLATFAAFFSFLSFFLSFYYGMAVWDKAGEKAYLGKER